MTIPSQTAKHRFEVLDSWRGICALLVATMHFETLSSIYEWSFVRHSFIFVDFFFVLSGFVISYSYKDRLRSPRAAAAFQMKRLGRIYPVHIVMLVILVATQVMAYGLYRALHVTLLKPPFTGAWDLGSLPLNMFLLHSFGLTDHNSWNNASWSIGAEFWVYGLFALLATLARKHLAIWSALIAISAAVTLYRFAPNYIDSQYDFGFVRCAFGFFCGVLLQIYWKKLSIPIFLGTGFEFAMLLFIVVFACYAATGPISLTAPLLMVLAVWLYSQQSGYISRLLDAGIFQRLGQLSYSIYMTHALLALVLFRNLPPVLAKLFHSPPPMKTIVYNGDVRHLFFPGSFWAADMYLVAYLAMVLGLAYVSYRYVEVPSRTWIYKKVDTWFLKGALSSKETRSPELA